MTGWFTRTSSVFRRAAPEVEHPFAVACDCGEIHRGLRRGRHQRLVCRECGATRFILPRDVYPAPRERRAAAATAPAPLPILKPVEEAPPERDRSPGSATRTRVAEPKPSASKKKESPELIVPVRGRFWTPFRFVALGISLVCALIAFTLVRKLQKDRAIVVLRTAPDEGAMRLAEEDWTGARAEYQAAVDAVNTLGRHDEAARRYRQALRETTVLTGLCNGSLHDLLREAEKHADDAEGWQTTFRARYQDQWMVFEAPLQSEVDDDGRTQWSIDFPIPIGKAGRSVAIVANLDAFRQLKRSSTTQPVIFAAQIEGCTLSKDRRSWQVVLRPDSGFLWALPSTYLGLGFSFSEWHPRDAVIEVLKTQAALVEIEIEAQE